MKILFLVMGLIVGAAAALVVQSLGGEGAGGDADPSALRAENEDLSAEVARLGNLREADAAKHEDEILDLKAEVADLKAELAKLREEHPAPVIEPVEDEPIEPMTLPTLEDLEKGMKEFARSLQAVIMGQNSAEAAKKKLRELFAAASPADLQKLLEEYESAADMGQKLSMAHAMANSGRPELIEALEKIARDPERGFLDRRMVVHGLAFVGDPALDPFLREVATTDQDNGVRANAAFGLARRGDAQGLDLYAKATDTAFETKDSTAMQYLGGFFLLGKKALPAARERLTSPTYQDRQARVMLIELLKSQKDVDGVDELEQVAASDPDQAVREAARKAIDEIRKAETEGD